MRPARSSSLISARRLHPEPTPPPRQRKHSSIFRLTRQQNRRVAVLTAPQPLHNADKNWTNATDTVLATRYWTTRHPAPPEVVSGRRLPRYGPAGRATRDAFFPRAREARA